MDWAWNPWGLPGTLAFLLGLGMAALIYRARPRRPQNRRLAALLAWAAVTMWSYTGLRLFLARPEHVYLATTVMVATVMAWPLLYARFLATLDTPLAKRLRWRGTTPFLVAYTFAVELLLLARPDLFLAGLGGPIGYLPGPLFYVCVMGANFAAFLLAIAVTLTAFLGARTPILRRQMKAYAAAFLLRDGLFGAYIPLLLVHPFSLGEDSLYIAATESVFIVLLGYGILRTQLFDIELKIKWTLRQSTILGAFVALYVAATQVGGLLLPSGWAPYVGLAGAALLVPFLGPLERAAQRVANAMMPRVRAAPDYISERKLEVYRAAVEQALTQDSSEPRADSPALAALRAELGVTERDHAVLWHAVRASLGPRPHAGLEAGAEVLGRYRVVRLLGEGSFGRTFLVQARDDGGARVLKVMRPDRRSDPEMLREARALVAVRHPNVVEFLGVEREGGQVFLVLEYVEGGSLADRLARGRLDSTEFHRVALDTLAALEAVHGAGLVHRDIKPSNVLLTREGRAKLADFGVAHVPGAETTLSGTSAGAVGTVRFMSPEQARGKRVTGRSDVFSAAAMLYEAYTGMPYLAPLPNETVVEQQLRAAAAGPFDRPLSGPPALRAWFLRALDPAPDARFGSAAEARSALEAALGPGPAPPAR
jgi:hypothetical protein